MANPSRRLSAGASSLARIFSAKPRAPTAAPPIKQESAAPPPRRQQKQRDFVLYRKLTALGASEGEVTTAIDEYTKEGKIVKKTELERCIRDFRRFKRYRHVVEVGEWMAQKFTFKQKDDAIHLEAIAKIKGIAAAEDYFNELPAPKRGKSTCGALLKCYCLEKMSDKALDLFDKMVEEKMIDTPLPFNHLMQMHIRLGEPEKAILLGEELKKANIRPDTSTFNLLMSGYSRLNDLEGMEGVFKEMTEGSKELVDWTIYSHLANIYVQAGEHEKARSALDALEKVKRANERDAYHFMISIYAKMNDLDNVRRVWKSLKSDRSVIWNTSYLVMVRTLDNLDDMEGLKECFEEWEKVCSSYDVRLANTVIGAYLRHDMLEEAEAVIQSMLKRSKGPFFYAFEILMNFYLKKHDVAKAMKIMEAATSKAVDGEWKPLRGTVDGFMDYFKGESDVSGAEEFYELMKRIKCVDTHFYESLLRIYDGAGQKLSDARARIEGDGVDITSELEDLVESVSLE